MSAQVRTRLLIVMGGVELVLGLVDLLVEHRTIGVLYVGLGALFIAVSGAKTKGS